MPFSSPVGFFVRSIKCGRIVFYWAHKVFLLCDLAWPIVFHCTRKRFRFPDPSGARARPTSLHALHMKTHDAAAIVRGEGEKKEEEGERKKATRHLISRDVLIHKQISLSCRMTDRCKNRQRERPIADRFAIIDRCSRISETSSGLNMSNARM
jgi:hypothetical protein